MAFLRRVRIALAGPLLLALSAPAAPPDGRPLSTRAAEEFSRVLAAQGLDWPPYAFAKLEYARSLDEPGGEGAKLWRIAASSGPVKIRLRIEKGLDAARARRRTMAEITRLNMLYEGPAAYPGMITTTNAVPPSLRPRERPAPRGGGALWLIPATPRLSYGAATPDEVAYEALMTFRYCPRMRVWARLEVFWPAKSFREAAALDEASLFDCLKAAPRRPSP